MRAEEAVGDHGAVGEFEEGVRMGRVRVVRCERGAHLKVIDVGDDTSGGSRRRCGLRVRRGRRGWLRRSQVDDGQGQGQHKERGDGADDAKEISPFLPCCCFEAGSSGNPTSGPRQEIHRQDGDLGCQQKIIGGEPEQIRGKIGYGHMIGRGGDEVADLKYYRTHGPDGRKRVYATVPQEGGRSHDSRNGAHYGEPVSMRYSKMPNRPIRNQEVYA